MAYPGFVDTLPVLLFFVSMIAYCMFAAKWEVEDRKLRHERRARWVYEVNALKRPSKRS